MSLYTVLLFVHILGAIVWVGGSVSLQVLGMRVRSSSDPQRMAALAHDAEWMGIRLYMPASALVLLAGIALVISGSWSFGQLWILLGLAAFAFSFIMGATMVGPTAKKLGTRIASHGPDDSEAQALIQRIFLLSRIELAVLIFIVFDMATKPGA
ncbi:MAG TPA: DUF2269 family protein [Actinomycetota bacterium]|nr:DUF2269 family protein [Actinomycetota bacterium]